MLPLQCSLLTECVLSESDELAASQAPGISIKNLNVYGQFVTGSSRREPLCPRQLQHHQTKQWVATNKL